jgi:predicted acyltransferase
MIMTGLGILAGYAVTMLYLPVPGFGSPDLDLGLGQADGVPRALFSNWCFYVDTQVLGWRALHHVPSPDGSSVAWAFDPEGVLSTLPALVTVLLGVLWGQVLHRRLAWRPAVGIAAGLIVAGLLLHPWLPINKRLWTSSYVLLTGGLAVAGLALCVQLIEVGGWRRWATPFVWLGRNAITAFFFSGLAARLLVHIRVPVPATAAGPGSTTLKNWLYENLFAAWAGPRLGSLLFALGAVLIWIGITGLLHRRRIYLKV